MGERVVDSFDNDRSLDDAAAQRDARWWTSNSAVCAMSTTAEAYGNSTVSLHVAYTKPAGSEWDFIAAGGLDQPANLSYWAVHSKFSLRINGQVDLLFKFRDVNNHESGDSPVFAVNSPGSWQFLTWNFTDLNWGSCDPRQVKEILIFPQPGRQGGGEFYLDDLVVGDPVELTVTATPSAVLTPDIRLWVKAKDIVAYPNPGHEQINFVYVISGPSTLTIDIYNLYGERVAHMVEQSNGPDGTLAKSVWNCRRVAPGIYCYRWSVRDNSGQPARSGVKKLAVIR